MYRATKIGLLFLFFVFFSCRKQVEFPLEPIITFKEVVQGPDSVNTDYYYADIIFGFTDGDGDIGENSGSGKTNFFPTLYHKKNGAFQKVEMTPSSIQKLSESKQALEGEITYHFTPSTDIYVFEPDAGDTLKYEFYIMDRAGNKSNTVITSEFLGRKP